MKKKLVAFILALVSVVACAVCLSACGGEVDEGGETNPQDYVGTYYEIGYIDKRINENGEVVAYCEDDYDEPFDLICTILSEDGKFKMLSHGNIITAGTWSVSGGKLVFVFDENDEDASLSAYLKDGVLFVEISISYGDDDETYTYISTAKFKKAVEGNQTDEENPQ